MRFSKKIVFLFLMVAIAFTTFALNVKAVGVVTGFTYNMSTQLGADSSKEMNINFFSNSDKAYVEYTLATDANFASAIKVEGNKMQLGDKFADFSDDDPVQDARYYTTTDYNYEINLTDLTPGTEYIYRVTDGSQKSDVYKFKTSTGGNDAFTFLYIADPQLYSESGANAYYYCVDEANKMANKNGTPIDFLIGGGDQVESGGDCYFWSRLYDLPLMKEVPYMAVTGNHEFTGLQSYLGVDGRFYTSMVNNPKNGVDTYGEYSEVSCFYKYNDTLFVQLCSSGKERNTQVEWLDKVLTENTAQFVIVIVHYPVVSNATDNFNTLIPVLDKHGVDLVLYGHTHTFAIQKNYYNWKASKVEGLGTTYQSQSSSEKQSSDVSPYALITVANNLIQVKNFNLVGGQMESYTLKAKRSQTASLEAFDKASFESEIKITPNFDDTTKATISWPKNGYNNVEYVNVLNENNEVVSENFVFSDVITTATLSGLELNKEYNYNFELKYSDGSSNTVPVKFSTTEVFGELQELEIGTTASRFKMTYTPKFKDSVKSLKVYVNGEFVQDAKTSDIRILISLDVFKENEPNTVTLKGVLGDGTEVLIYEVVHGEEDPALKELAEAKEAAKTQIADAVSKLDASKYEDKDFSKITAKKEEVLGKVDACESKEAVQALVDELTKLISETPLKDEFKADREGAVKKVNDCVAGLKEADYTEANWKDIKAKQAKALEDIEKAETKEAIEKVADDFVNFAEGVEKAPTEKAGGCGNAASILFVSLMLLGFCLIRRKH